MPLSFVIPDRKGRARRLSITGKEGFVNADFLLIQKMRRGDEQAFDLFVRGHYEALLKYCYYHCFDAAYAEDLTQETFLRFFEKLSDYRYLGKTRNYLYTIAGNLCRDYYKKTKECSLEELPEEAQAAPQGPEEEEILDQFTVQAAVNALPEEWREIIILYYFQGLRLAEIAGLLGIGLPLVKYRMKQAKKRLEQLLGEE